MSNSRMQAPPGNLKERIAALQQRNISPPSQKPSHSSLSTSKPVSPGTTSGGGGLRDKIAKFEKKGGVPVPRGSFGLGAPPTADDAKSGRSRELYGNRIPGYVRAPSGPTSSRSSSPFSSESTSPGGRKRCISTSQLDLAAPVSPAASDSDSLLSSASPLQSPSLNTTAVIPQPLSSPRRNTLTANFGGGRRAASSSDVFSEYHSYPQSPPTFPSPLQPSTSAVAQPVSAAESRVIPPSIVVSSDNLLSSVDEVSPIDIKDEPIQVAQETTTLPAQPPLEISSSEISPTGFANEGSISADANKESAVNSPSGPLLNVEALSATSTSTSSPTSVAELPTPSATNSSQIDQAGDKKSISHPKDEYVMHVPESTSLSLQTLSPLKASSSPADMSSSLLSKGVPKQSEDQSTTISSPPFLPIDAGEADIRLARRVSPTTSRAVPVVVPATPPTPSVEPDDAEISFGSVTISRSSDDQPQKPRQGYREPDMASTRQPPSFSVVVHGKIVENKLNLTSNSLPPKAPTTPQIARIRRLAQTQTPQSPGYGELAVLLEDAALLEKRLMEGGLEEEVVQETASIAEIPEEDHEVIPEPVIPHTPPRSHFDSHVSEQAHHQSPSARSASAKSIPRHDSQDTLNYSSAHSEDASIDEIPPTPPPKSPMPKYLSGLRRLTSGRSSNTMPGAYPRNSMSASSEISSEDSVPVATPPDSTFDSSSQRGKGSSGSSSSGFGLGWPSISPKKSSSSLSRASSFAERILHRSRTKSGVSVVEPADPIPTISLTHSRTPSIAPLNLSYLPSPIKEDSPQTLSPQRPESWISQSSGTSSTVSPSGAIFNEIFDAFPSVPQDVPIVPIQSSTDPRLRMQSHHTHHNVRSSKLYHPHPESRLSSPGYSESDGAYAGRSATLPVRSRKDAGQPF